MQNTFCLLIGVLFSLCSRAQVSSLQVTHNKTTTLVFPTAIKHIDRGSKEVLVHHVKNVPNVLLLKAANEGLKETNLSVVTEDGEVYVFDICYGTAPALYKLQSKVDIESRAVQDNRVSHSPQCLAQDKHAGAQLLLKSLSVNKEATRLVLNLKNRGVSPYELAYIRCFLKDRKRTKQTAVQDWQLHTLRIFPKVSSLLIDGTQTFEVVLERFAVSKGKYLLIEVGERQGERLMRLKIGYRKFKQAVSRH